jgi:hypothetical protein
MFALRLAMFCLLTSSMSVPMAAFPAGGTVAISLRLRTGTVRAAALEEMQKELAGLMYGVGMAAQWEDPTNYRDVNGYIVVVDLEGDCSVPVHAETEPLPEGTPLGTTATAENHILPFVSVNCKTLNALLAPFMADQPAAFRDFVFGRALGRVLAHELYHVVTQSGDHLDSGLAKARFSAADLMKNQFEFSEMALDRIHASQTAVTAAAAFDSPSSDGFEDASGGK